MENVYYLYLNGCTWIFSALLLWIGQRLKMDWFRFDKALGKKEFLSWWWKVLALILVMVLGVVVLGGFTAMAMEADVYRPNMGILLWFLTPVAAAYFPLMIAVLIRRARALKHGKAIGIVTVILALIPPVMGELVLWLLFLLLYYLPEKQGEPAAPVMAE